MYIPAIIRCWLIGYNNCLFHSQYGTSPKLYFKVQTQAYIIFNVTKIIKYIWYRNYSKKLCDYKIIIGWIDKMYHGMI